MTLGVVLGIICLVLFAFMFGNRVGQVLAQLDALSEYAEAIHNNIIVLIDLVKGTLTEEEENSAE